MPQNISSTTMIAVALKFTALVSVMNETGRETGTGTETDKHPERMTIRLLGRKWCPEASETVRKILRMQREVKEQR